MDRSVRDTSSGNGEHSSCYCFRGTCQFCAPSIKTIKKTQVSESSGKQKNKEGETKYE